MTTTLLRGVFLTVLAGAMAAPASAGELKLTMQDGRVTIIADNVPVRQILQEWQRVGQTQILNIDKLGAGNLTLQIVDAPERDALDIILRSANGYIAAPRVTPVAGAAVYDRITIFVSSTRAPAQVAAAAQVPTFQRPPQPDDSDEPINVAMPPTPAGQVPGMPPQLPPQLQQLQQLQQNLQQQNQGLAAPGNSPLTAPRPGALPQPSVPGMVPNPYQPVPIKPGGGGPGGGGPGGQ
jgi:hypothetical protein